MILNLLEKQRRQTFLVVLGRFSVAQVEEMAIRQVIQLLQYAETVSCAGRKELALGSEMSILMTIIGAGHTFSILRCVDCQGFSICRGASAEVRLCGDIIQHPCSLGAREGYPEHDQLCSK